MFRLLKFNDRVIIKDSCTSFSTGNKNTKSKYCGEHGIIMNAPKYHGRVSVKLDNFINERSKTGWFDFWESELEMIKEGETK